MQIEMLEPEAPTAEAPATSTALTLPQRAEVALGSTKVRTELAELVQASAAIVEIKNKAGRDECHGAAMRLVRARTAIEKLSKDARADAQAFSRAVIAEERSLIGITEDEERRLLGLRDAWDAAEKAAKAEAERKERERIQTIQLRIADIRECAILAAECRTSAMVQRLIDKMTAQPLEGFDEFASEAEKARDESLARLAKIRDAKVAEEAERERVRAEQEAENQRLAQQRAEQERQDAERRAEDQRLQAQRDELERQRREFKAELDKRAAEAKALETVTAADPAPAPAPTTHPNGAPMFSTTTFKENGDPIMLDSNGKRSVFCDIDDEPQPAPPTLKLGQICDRLGFTVSGEFLKGLGIEPRALDKRALLFYESDFQRICKALIARITRVAMLDEQIHIS